MEDQEFEQKDEEKDNEGEEGYSSIMVSTVSTATATAAILALQSHRSLGQPLRWMEQVKMDRLRQVNGETSRLGHLSHTAPSKVQSLPTLTGKGETLYKFTLCMLLLLLLFSLLTLCTIGNLSCSQDQFTLFL